MPRGVVIRQVINALRRDARIARGALQRDLVQDGAAPARCVGGSE
jgi:hypothetical protein